MKGLLTMSIRIQEETGTATVGNVTLRRDGNDYYMSGIPGVDGEVQCTSRQLASVANTVSKWRTKGLKDLSFANTLKEIEFDVDSTDDQVEVEAEEEGRVAEWAQRARNFLSARRQWRNVFEAWPNHISTGRVLGSTDGLRDLTASTLYRSVVGGAEGRVAKAIRAYTA